MARPGAALQCVAHLPDGYRTLARDIVEILPDQHHDDGSYIPLLIRLAWHSAGTYDAQTKTGGSNGATMRFLPEKDDPANAGLHVARDLLEFQVKQKHPWISFSDLWILASYIAIEVSGGPVIMFRPGRRDLCIDRSPVQPGRLPNAEQNILGADLSSNFEAEKAANVAHIRSVFGRMGFNDQEMVALIAGGHVYGRCHVLRVPFFTVTKFREQNCPVAGNKQYVNVDGTIMMLFTDMALTWDEVFKKHLERYASNMKVFREDFGKAYKKLTELGCEHLLSASSVSKL